MAEGRTPHPRDQRHKALERLLGALAIEHARIPSTKVDTIVTGAFYLEILERLATRVVALEALAKRSDGLADVLVALLDPEERAEGNIAELVEAVNVLLSRRSIPDEAKADDNK